MESIITSHPAEALTAALLLSTSLNFYIEFRQLRRLRSQNKAPKELRPFADSVAAMLDKKQQAEAAASTTGAVSAVARDGVAKSALERLDAEVLQSNRYAVRRLRFGLLHSLFELAQTVATFVFGVLPLVYATLGDALGLESEIWKSAALLAASSLVSTLLDLPWQWYSTFVIEKEFGFCKTSVSTFVMDRVKSVLLTTVIGTAVLLPLIAILRYFATTLEMFAYSAAFVSTITFVLFCLGPLMMSLFNKFTPIEEYKRGEHDVDVALLRQDIVALAARIKFPLGKVLIADSSKRSSHSNAYQYGFVGAMRRIVIFDTLLSQASIDEIVAIVHHECGHWWHQHTLLLFVVGQLQLWSYLLLFAFCVHSDLLYSVTAGFVTYRSEAALAATSSRPIIIGLLAFSSLLEPFSLMIGGALHALVRRLEYQADRFAVDGGMGEMLKKGLVAIMSANLALTDPDPLYSTLHHSHPTLIERIRGIDAYSATTRGARPSSRGERKR